MAAFSYFSNVNSTNTIQRIKKKKIYNSSTENGIESLNSIKKAVKNVSPKLALKTKCRKALGDVSNATKKTNISSSNQEAKELTCKSSSTEHIKIQKPNPSGIKPHLIYENLLHSDVYSDDDNYDDIWPVSERIRSEKLEQFVQWKPFSIAPEICNEEITGSSFQLGLDEETRNSDLPQSLYDDTPLWDIPFDDY